MIARIAKEWVKDLTSLGSLPFYTLVVLFFAAISDLITAVRLIIILFAIYGITIPIRLIFAKERPDAKENKNRSAGWIERVDLASFPSIHSARIAALAYAINVYAGPLLQIFSIAAVILVIASRILLKRHYLIDTLAGAALGFIITSLSFLLF